MDYVLYKGVTLHIFRKGSWSLEDFAFAFALPAALLQVLKVASSDCLLLFCTVNTGMGPTNNRPV